jgi:hypothetical protein
MHFGRGCTKGALRAPKLMHFGRGCTNGALRAPQVQVQADVKFPLAYDTASLVFLSFKIIVPVGRQHTQKVLTLSEKS